MKTIFCEEHALPAVVSQHVEPNGNWDDRTRTYSPAVVTRRYNAGDFTASTTAHYDQDTGALVVVLSTTLWSVMDWRPADRKVLELHDTRESALRRTIAIADDWYQEVKAAIPPERDEAELIATWQAATEASPGGA